MENRIISQRLIIGGSGALIGAVALFGRASPDIDRYKALVGPANDPIEIRSARATVEAFDAHKFAIHRPEKAQLNNLLAGTLVSALAGAGAIGAGIALRGAAKRGRS